MKKYTWYKIADAVNELSFNENKLMETEVGGKKICVAFSKGVIYACAHKCPHAGGYMQDGFIDAGGNIVCSTHRYKFNLESGRNISGEGYYLKVFPVEMREEGIFVGIEDGGLFGMLK